MRPCSSRIVGAFAGKDHPVAVFEITDRVSEGRKRDSIGAKIHLALAIADGKRRTFARADQQIVLAGEKKSQRESAAQLLERCSDGIFRRLAALEFLRHEMRHSFGIGLADEFGSALGELFAQFTKVLDDAIVDDGHQIGGMRMRIVFRRTPVRCPARVTNADGAAEGFLREPRLERTQFALRAAATKNPVIERRYARRIIAAVLKPPERVDQLARDRLGSKNSDNSAHPSGWPLYPLLMV